MQNIEKLIKDFPSPDEIKALAADGGESWNRLIFQQSPYLLQHAANPVNWFPWSDEAFEKAQREGKVVMLSIGYATCHWCHVMEHECFEDSQVAAVLNEHLVCIKVDREERPDIDNLYMSLAQILIKRGGWPLNIFLTPERKAFYAATYVPKHSRHTPNGVSLGMLDLIPRIADHWRNQREQVMASAENLLDVFNQSNKGHNQVIEINDELLDEIYQITFEQLEKNFDNKFGGFGPAPKFPSPHIMSFLLEYHKRKKNDHALAMVEKTLTEMRLGGIFDQVGKGFHRYSTDTEWLLPHFEKMLYDQATLLIAYAESYSATQNPFYKNVINEIFEYLNRDLLSPHGAFYSAEDADSEGEEGKFYVWTTDELKNTLAVDEYEIAIKLFHCYEEGNFVDEATHEKTGANILILDKVDDLENPKLASIISKLFAERNKRIRPLLDDKLLTDWNALLAVALIKCTKATGDNKFLASAKKIIDFIFKELYQEGKLYKSYRKARSEVLACINDYSYLVWALLELYDLEANDDVLNRALALIDTMLKEFWAEDEAAFCFNRKDSSEIPARNFELYDGAIPSGNSVAFLVLNKAFKITQNISYKLTYEKLFSSYISDLERYPAGYAQFTTALKYCYSDYQETKFVCNENGCF
jgi:uncharacterized protein YyaL (SSP411 family)